MKHTIGLTLGIIAIALLWNTPVVYPIKLLVVFFHELSHALAVVATDGVVQEMVVNSDIGGYVVFIGGNRFVIATSGYLGSLLWGALIYIIAVKTDLDSFLMALLGSLLILVAVFYLSNGFGFIFSLVMGGAMIALGFKASHGLNTLLLRLIGLTSLLYVPIDIADDTLFRSYLPSDARRLAEEFGGSTWFWGGLWLMLSLILVYYTLSLTRPKVNQIEAS